MTSGEAGRSASSAEPAWDGAQRAVLGLGVGASGVVVGAPGTGKTAVLVERLRRLVGAGLDPDEVLVLTPTRQTATALRDRLALAVGRASSGPLARSTASLAFQLVRAAEVAAGREPPQLLTGGDEDQIVQDLLEGDAEDEAAGRRRWPDWIGADIRATKGFRAEVRRFLAECTTLGIGPARLAELGRAHDVPVWASLAAFAEDYHAVRAQMRGAHRDAAGLVREAVGLLSAATGDGGLGGFAGVRAVLVDDAQELTLGGVDLLRAWHARGVAVLAFGDPDIGAGAFRGATPENFALLARALGGVVAALDVQHRSTAAQADLVRIVTQRIGAGGVAGHRRPPAGGGFDESVRALLLRSSSEESDVVARLLRERHIHDGVPWSQLAVIAHDTRQVAALEAELVAREVPARASGPGSPLGTLPPVRDLLRIVEFAADPAVRSADELSTVLTGAFGGLDPVGLRRLRTALRHQELGAGGERAGRELLASAMGQPLEFDLVDIPEARRAARVARTIAAVRDELDRGATAHEVLWVVWERSGLERAWAEAARGHGPVAEQANRDLDAVVALFQSAKRFVERQGVEGEGAGRDAAATLAFVRGVLSADVAEDRLDRAARQESVAVLTPAAAVGAEFDTVVVAGVQDGVWPNTRLRGSLLETWRLADAAARPHGDTSAPDILDRRRSAMHDELRLLVRAVSRAKERLVVTAVDDDDTGPSVFFEFLPAPDPVPRRMEHPLSLRGLVARHRRALTEGGGGAAAAAAGQLAVLSTAGVPGARPDEWYGMLPITTDAPLRDLAVEDVRVSPSRLHTLEECPLNWVIGDLGGDPGGAVAGLGTIVHAALEQAESADETALWAIVEARWGELEFESAWRDRAEQTRARDFIRRLSLYLRRFDESGGRLIGAEPHFEIAIPLDESETFDHGVVLSGYIDRVELTPAGTVVIVDLKTGKSEPQTDRAVADNPQLAAYQLAFESGAIEQAQGLPPGGAKLLVLRPTAASRDYAEPWQPPFDEERRAAFVDRVRRAVHVMRGRRFEAPFEEHCRDEYSYGLCRIHTVKAVSAS